MHQYHTLYIRKIAVKGKITAIVITEIGEEKYFLNGDI